MKHINYAIMVEEDSHYPVSYTIKQNGTKVIENTMLKGGDMTEVQIKELFFSGYFKEKPIKEEIEELSKNAPLCEFPKIDFKSLQSEYLEQIPILNSLSETKIYDKPKSKFHR